MPQATRKKLGVQLEEGWCLQELVSAAMQTYLFPSSLYDNGRALDWGRRIRHDCPTIERMHNKGRG